jgi:large subunit ribosomal protein L17
MAMVELVDYNEIYNPNGKKVKKATRRKGKASKTETVTAETIESAEQTPKENV